MTLTPKNWKTFQHYTDRRPAWIKLHRGLLDDYTFSRLPVASRALAPLLWLLASEYNEGIIPSTFEEISFRLRCSEKELLEAINPLIDAGFFTSDSGLLADCKQLACLEKRERTRKRETQVEREKEKKPAKSLLPGDWMISNSHYELGKQKGLSRSDVEDAAGEMRSWSLGNGEKRTNWDWVFNNWLRRYAKGKDNGHGRSGPLQNSSGNIIPAQDRLIAKIAEFGRPTPVANLELRSGESTLDVRLLPKR